ncbi:MAG: DNRLRE domain-containing protein [Chthoniobacterales bacterium]
MKNKIKILLVSLLAALYGLLNSQAAVTTATIPAPSEDAFVSSDGVGQGSGLPSGQISRINGTVNRHYLLKFNTTPYNGQSLVKATLTLRLSNPLTTSGTPVTPPKIRIYKMNTSWVNGATWTSRGGAMGSWSGSYGPSASADYTNPVAVLAPSPTNPPPGVQYTFDITTVVSDWMDGSLANNGLIIVWDNAWTDVNSATDYNRQWTWFAGSGVLAPKLDLTFATGPTVNVKTQYGAVGNGVTDDTAAFQAATTYLISQGGGTLFIPSGTYIVGDKANRHAAGVYPYYRPVNVMAFTGAGSAVNGLLIKTDGATATIKRDDGLHFGSFDKNTGAAIYPTLPYYDHDSVANPGLMIQILGAQNVLVKNLYLNGNSPNMVIGGKWANAGYQIAAYGFWAFNCSNVTVMRVTSSYNPADGFLVGYNGITENSPATPHTLHQCTAEYNGRQGLTWAGGIGLTVIGSQFNHTGKSNVQNNPAAGVDIEPDGPDEPCRKGLFYGCVFKNNNSGGVLSDGPYGGNSEFDHCYIEGTTNYALWPQAPYMRFIDCQIRGSLVACYFATAATSAAGTYFARCNFDDTIPGGSIFSNGMLVYIGGNYAVFDSCIFNAHLGEALYVTNDIIRNCTVTHFKPRDPNAIRAWIYGGTISNTHFMESFPAGFTNPSFIQADTNTVIGTGVVVDGPRVRWRIGYSPTSLIGTIPPTP